MKHRLVRFLVTELDVRALALEMGFTATLELGENVLRGAGDPAEILDGFGWLARTESFLELAGGRTGTPLDRGYFYEDDLGRHYERCSFPRGFDGLLFVEEITRALLL